MNKRGVSVLLGYSAFSGSNIRHDVEYPSQDLALVAVYSGGIIFYFCPYLTVEEKDAADQGGEYFCFLIVWYAVCCHSGLFSLVYIAGCIQE